MSSLKMLRLNYSFLYIYCKLFSRLWCLIAIKHLPLVEWWRMRSPFSRSICQENVMSESRVTKGLENNINIKEDRPQRERKTEI